jgi:N-acetylmuramic acid 6-phosphate (MurNAc-6-P) etherase
MTSSPAPPLRVTELSNPLTESLDVADPESFVRLLAGCDAQLFTGFAGLPNVSSSAITAAAVRASRAVAAALAHPRGRIVFGGCGTSGRLAQLLAEELNAWWARREPLLPAAPLSRFHYLLAGGDKALLVPQEAVEDQHDAGQKDLEAWCARVGVRGGASADPVVVVGISCGLSATYVASLLHACLPSPAGGAKGEQRARSFYPVAMGFNPVEAVRSVVVPGAPFTFHSVLRAMEAIQGGGGGGGSPQSPQQSSPPSASPNADLFPGAGGCAIVNPVVGPEAVAGSSRMKGGSITWVLCASIVAVAAELLSLAPPAADAGVVRAYAEADASLLASAFRGHVLAFEVAASQLYASSASPLAAVVAAAADSLAARRATAAAAAAAAASPTEPGRRLVSPTGSGRILYLGAGCAGLLGLVDASEATDTYGSHFNDVRGFVPGGWGRMGVAEAADGDDPEVPPELRGYHGEPAATAPPPPREVACPALSSFTDDFLPTLTPDDLVVLIRIPNPARMTAAERADADADDAQLLEAFALARKAGAKTAVVAAEASAPAAAAADEESSSLESKHAAFLDAAVSLASVGGVRVPLAMPQLPVPAFGARPVAAGVGVPAPWLTASSPPLAATLAVKLALNAITTGAHVAGRGVVMGNRMVNMMLTNHKLFLRAIGIVAAVAGCDQGAARRCVLRSIYGSALGDAELEGFDDSDAAVVGRHIAVASQGERVIPTALMLALGGGGGGEGGLLTPERAREVLREEPRVRRALGRV